MTHEDFEKVVIEALLAGDEPDLAALRSQHARSRVREREWTGSGVFVRFDVPADSPPTRAAKFHLGDVQIDLAGGSTPAEAILWVRGGRLESLECFLYDGDWPRNPVILKIDYFGGERDPKYVQRQLSA